MTIKKSTHAGNDMDEIRELLLEVHNNPKKYESYIYEEKQNLYDDFKSLIKACSKYGIQFRYTNPTSKKQVLFTDKDGRIKILGAKGNCLKSDTIFHYSRLKYIISLQNKLSILSIKRIVTDRKHIKEIDIDHFNNNKLDNRLCNLKPRPHKVNCSSDYDRLKTMARNGRIHEAKQYAKKIDKENLLLFIF